MDFKGSFNSYVGNDQHPKGKELHLTVKTPAAPRAPMEYERKSLIIPRRPLWF